MTRKSETISVYKSGNLWDTAEKLINRYSKDGINHIMVGVPKHLKQPRAD